MYNSPDKVRHVQHGLGVLKRQQFRGEGCSNDFARMLEMKEHIDER
jgi:hypothetical protein